jgi:putative addiction module component (TIGR02574 family)
MKTYETILQEAAELSVVDRMQLIEDLWESVAENELPPLTTDWKAEIQRRSAAFDAGEVTVTPWNEIKANTLGRLDHEDDQK